MAASSAGLVVPTLHDWPVVGSLRGLRHDYLGTISRADRDVGGLARIVAGPPGWRLVLYSVTSPELIAEVLGNPDRFGKQHPGYRELRRAIGGNVLTSEDEAWHRQRRFLASMFTRRRVESVYAPVMVEEAQRLVTRWRTAATRQDTLDAYPELVAMASRVSGRILFGADMSAAAQLLTRFRRVNDQLLRRAVSPHPLPTWAPTPGNRRMNEGLRQVRQIVDGLISRRRQQPADPDGDMLGMLITARDAENEADRIGDREIADQAMLFLLAGHDTTAVTLSCILLQLAQRPHWQELLREEIDKVLGGRPPVGADLPRLPWTARTVREAMRLFPAAHGVGRSPIRDELLGGCHIPAHAWVEVSIWGVHHSPRVWPAPERFDPTRFDMPDGQPPGGHKYTWMPFGAGARACIGMPIAMAEVQIAVATILQQLMVSTPLSRTPVHAAITLLPTGALPLRVAPR